MLWNASTQDLPTGPGLEVRVGRPMLANKNFGAVSAVLWGNNKWKSCDVSSDMTEETKHLCQNVPSRTLLLASGQPGMSCVVYGPTLIFLNLRTLSCRMLFFHCMPSMFVYRDKFYVKHWPKSNTTTWCLGRSQSRTCPKSSIGCINWMIY